MSTSSWAQARNLLCVRLDTIGDVLMTTPALRALKESLPGARLTLLTSPIGAQVGALVPEIDEVIEYEAPWMKASGEAVAESDRRALEDVASRSFDAAVIFTVYSQNPLPAALFCHLAGIPRRLAHCRENPYRLLTDWVQEPEPQEGVRHEVRRQLDLVRQVGCTTSDERLSLQLSVAARRRAAERLQATGLDPAGDWVLLHPGASAASRRYPADGFAAAARILRDHHGLRIVLVGDEADAPLIDQIRGELGDAVSDLSAGQDVEELAAIIEAAPLLIANNSGPAHIAAAVGTPIVDLYALTNPQHTPWGVDTRVLTNDVPCRFCYRSVCPEGHHLCLRGIEPEAVAAAALDLLQGVSGRRRSRLQAQTA